MDNMCIMKVSFETMQQEFERVLLALSFPGEKAHLCATVFAKNSLDGVYSHGVNRFPTFVGLVKEGLVKPEGDPVQIESLGNLERWHGNLGLGIYNATHCMNRAIGLAKENGIGLVSIQNTNHWMRGGTYGWQAADAGCIGICFTNAIAGMPPWGGKSPALGNNPLVIAVPRNEGHIVLDMAMSQYSYGKLQEYTLRGEHLPFPGGYDDQGELTYDPAVVQKNKRALPIGFWKGSGLALLIDILVTSLSGGRSTKQMTMDKKEYGVSQVFIAIHQKDYHRSLIEAILAYTKSAEPAKPGDTIAYPGENTMRTRIRNSREGIPVHDQVWESILKL